MRRLMNLVLTFALMLCLFSCGGNDEFFKISSSKVVKITGGGALSIGDELNEDDVKTFIKLYNKSEYAGEGSYDVGETTPDYGVDVYFEDGSHLSVSECIAKDRDFDVRLYNADREQVAWFYLVNEELTTFFIEPMMETGQYYAEGDYDDKLLVPSVYLNTETKVFSFSYGDIISNAYNGTYEIKGKRLFVTCDDANLEFYINQDNWLILESVENADWMTLPIGTYFWFNYGGENFWENYFSRQSYVRE